MEQLKEGNKSDIVRKAVKDVSFRKEIEVIGVSKGFNRGRYLTCDEVKDKSKERDKYYDTDEGDSDIDNDEEVFEVGDKGQRKVENEEEKENKIEKESTKNDNKACEENNGPENDERESEREGKDEDNEPEKNEKEMEKESTKKDNRVPDEVEEHESEETDSEEEMKEDGSNGKKTVKTKKTKKKKKKKQVKNACTECEREVKKGGSLRCAGCYRDCHYQCAGFKDKEDHARNINKIPTYKCEGCKLEINEKRKRGRPRRRNSVPDIVLSAKENNDQKKRKRIVEEGLPKKVSPLKKKNKIGDEKTEETDWEDWKS